MDPVEPALQAREHLNDLVLSSRAILDSLANLRLDDPTFGPAELQAAQGRYLESYRHLKTAIAEMTRREEEKKLIAGSGDPSSADSVAEIRMLTETRLSLQQTLFEKNKQMKVIIDALRDLQHLMACTHGASSS
mmetsp:Transcript_39699/g.64394  ORF Transcript_39699/g.64394 Transcript_39699/m.64394 type:complete len:134 (-) Transcript_39699:218-619(-)|eukprot:CAMPEP_0184664750 /NCGR_PEP_ID=MMETSP0308-20130426/54230_1 /TAXON_ID=38269 /ORGANISM="Gloeochaete witrockiana, Strain SAG 46.84" /LENGTH=133 /DNA_ID=CAMNT_0027108339 /DNA_START=44 /DNA_END=445 /DNA_ORIENTATION=+